MKKNTNADEIVGVFSHLLGREVINKQLDAQMREIEKAKAEIESSYTNAEEKVQAIARLDENAELMKRERAVVVLQTNVRIFLSKLRLHRADVSQNSARIITKVVRIFSASKKLRRQALEARAYRTLTNIFVAYRVHKKEIKKLKSTPQLFCVEIVKADHLISADGISSGVFAYTMSAVDESGAFRGAAETDIKNGYGLRSLGLHRSSTQPFSHDPVWEKEDEDEDSRHKEKCYVMATSDSYLVITLMSKNAVKDTESYLGQAVISLADYENELYYEKSERRKNSIHLKTVCGLKICMAQLQSRFGTRSLKGTLHL